VGGKVIAKGAKIAAPSVKAAWQHVMRTNPGLKLFMQKMGIKITHAAEAVGSKVGRFDQAADSFLSRHWTKATGRAATGEATAASGGAVSIREATAQLSSKYAGKKVNPVWNLSPFQRGVAIEESIGHNLTKNFPSVDRLGRPVIGSFWINKKVIYSIKSIDLRAVTYQNPAKLKSVLKKHIDNIAGKKDFGKSPTSRLELGKHFEKIGLDLRIPFKPVGDQARVLSEMAQYAKDQNVQFLQKIF